MDFLILFLFLIFLTAIGCYCFYFKKLKANFFEEKKKLQEEITIANEINQLQNEKLVISEELKNKLHESRILLDKDLLYLQKDLIEKLNSNNLLDS